MGTHDKIVKWVNLAAFNTENFNLLSTTSCHIMNIKVGKLKSFSFTPLLYTLQTKMSKLLNLTRVNPLAQEKNFHHGHKGSMSYSKPNKERKC